MCSNTALEVYKGRIFKTKVIKKLAGLARSGIQATISALTRPRVCKNSLYHRVTKSSRFRYAQLNLYITCHCFCNNVMLELHLFKKKTYLCADFIFRLYSIFVEYRITRILMRTKTITCLNTVLKNLTETITSI